MTDLIKKTKQLEEILQKMDVPIFRIGDLHWLSRNLGIRNAEHPLFDKAMQLIKELLLA